MLAIEECRSEDYNFALTTLKAQLLTTIPTTDKAPYKFDQYIRTTCQSGTGINSIILQHSFQTWFALCIAQRKHPELTTRLEKLSHDERTALLNQLNSVRPDNSYYDLWKRTFQSSLRGPRRLRELRHSHNLTIPGVLEGSLESDADSASDLESLSSHRRLQTTSHKGGQYEWPNAERLPRVFPHRLSRIIRKDADGRAAIFASFPADPTKCRLEFDVINRMVPFTAKELYNVHISYHDERCKMILQDGVEVEVLGSIVLRGASNNTSPGFVGPQLGMAYRSSPRFRKEQHLGEELTQCLAMTIEANVTSSGRLSLTMEAESLEAIVQNLWR